MTTATEAMTLNAEGQRLERRDRALALSIGREMVERFFQPLQIEDTRDIREQITNAAEHAAYEAIQRERQLHVEDMLALRLWYKARFADAILNFKPQLVENAKC